MSFVKSQTNWRKRGIATLSARRNAFVRMPYWHDPAVGQGVIMNSLEIAVTWDRTEMRSGYEVEVPGLFRQMLAINKAVCDPGER